MAAPVSTAKHMAINLAESLSAATNFFSVMRRMNKATANAPTAPMPPPSAGVNMPP